MLIRFPLDRTPYRLLRVVRLIRCFLSRHLGGSMKRILCVALWMLAALTSPANAYVLPVPFIKEQSVFEQARFPRGVYSSGISGTSVVNLGVVQSAGSM